MWVSSIKDLIIEIRKAKLAFEESRWDKIKAKRTKLVARKCGDKSNNNVRKNEKRLKKTKLEAKNPPPLK